MTSLNFACWSLIKIFYQNTLCKKHLLISKQQEDKGKTCFVQGWDVTPKQNVKWQKSIIKWLTIQHHSWISFSSNICALPSIFLSFVNLRMFWWQYGWWHSLSQTQLASCSPSSDLDSWKFCNYSNEWPKTPPWYSHLLSGLYHIETVVVRDLMESRQ